MIVLSSFLIFAALGWIRASKRGGTTGDRVQYALVHGAAASLAALVAVVIAARFGLLA